MSDQLVLVILSIILLMSWGKSSVFRLILVLMAMYGMNILWAQAGSPIRGTDVFYIFGVTASVIASALAYIATRKSDNFLAFVPLLFVLTSGICIYSISFLDHKYLDRKYQDNLEFILIEVLVYFELLGLALVSFGNGLSKYTEYACGRIIRSLISVVRFIYPLEIHQGIDRQD